MEKTGEHGLHSIEAVLEQEITLTRKLYSILESEKKALAERNPELLMDLVSEKIRILEAIETTHNRNAAFYSAKKPGEFHWEILIQGMPDPKGSLLKKCEEYKKLLEEVEYLNTVNAKVSARMQSSINELIKIIRGNSQAQKLYTPKGNSSFNSNYTSIAKV